jgi:hypothetical protein
MDTGAFAALKGQLGEGRSFYSRGRGETLQRGGNCLLILQSKGKSNSSDSTP